MIQMCCQEIWTSFGYLLFETNITIEFGKVFYRKVIDNFLRFQQYKLELIWISRT